MVNMRDVVHYNEEKARMTDKKRDSQFPCLFSEMLLHYLFDLSNCDHFLVVNV